MNPLVKGDPTISLMQAARQRAAQQARMEAQAKKLKNYPQIEEAAKGFEAQFLSAMLKPMFAGVNKPDPLFGGGHGEQVFNGFMVREYGKLMAEHGGIGLAEHVKAELLKIQEAQNGKRQNTQH